MTDVENAFEGEPAPELIATHYLSSVEDLIEHVRAASQLGLGVRVHSYLEQDEETQTYAERWELELLTSAPVQQEDVVPEPAPVA